MWSSPTLCLTFWLMFLFESCLSSYANRLQGRLARCSDQNDLLMLPILAGNPCISCHCKDEQVICTRHRCPAQNECRGKLVKRAGKCCPVCVESSGCFTAERSYENGATWFEPDCQVCRCNNQTIHCQRQRCHLDLKCSKGHKRGLVPGSCCLQCIEDTAVCTSYGDPHFQTFDGRMYNFRGNCRYKLTADCKHDNFTVRMRNERLPSRSRAKYLAISIGSTHINLQAGMAVRVDKQTVKLPYFQLPQLQITKENSILTVLTDIGVQILWDGDSFIEVHVPIRYQGNTCGLCGNFNGDPDDDFQLKNGQTTTSVHKFATSWAIGRQRHNCKRAPAPPKKTARCSLKHEWRARKRCWPIKSHFSNCHKSVDPHRYYRGCINDVCSCHNKRCECESLLAYARACRRMGVVVKWSRRNLCGISCKGGSIFDDCVPSCKQTCRSKEEPSLACPNQYCVPGCRCPAGQVWDDRSRTCIFTWMCPAPVNTHRT